MQSVVDAPACLFSLPFGQQRLVAGAFDMKELLRNEHVEGFADRCTVPASLLQELRARHPVLAFSSAGAGIGPAESLSHDDAEQAPFGVFERGHDFAEEIVGKRRGVGVDTLRSGGSSRRASNGWRFREEMHVCSWRAAVSVPGGYNVFMRRTMCKQSDGLKHSKRA